MNLLITGGYGFIGMYLTKRLLEDGHRVWVYDLLDKPPKGMEEYFKGSVGIQGNLLEQESFFKAIEENKIDRLIHMAALRNNDSQRMPLRAFQLNCEGFMNCLEAARTFGLDRLVYASSVTVLGNFDYYRRNHYDEDRLYYLPEDSARQPGNVYGVTKLFNELMAEQYGKIYGLHTVGARLPIIYGAGKKGGSKTSTFNDMIEGCWKGEKMEIERRPDKFNITYVKDAAKGLYCAATAENPKSGVYNIGGYTVDMREYADTIMKLFPGGSIKLVENLNAPTPLNTCMDSSAALAELNYKPDFTLEEGILDHIETIRKSDDSE